MPNQFKCNNSVSTPKETIDSFNAVYDFYLQSKNSNTLNSNFIAPAEWQNTHCDQNSCPSNVNQNTVAQSHNFYTTVGGVNKILNSDLARYLNHCATNITLTEQSPYYGSGNPANKRYSQTMTLRDVSYNNLLTDRNDLDRKMKEVLALQGSMVNEQQNYVDGSVYTTLLWTVMATSLVYYVFTKI